MKPHLSHLSTLLILLLALPTLADDQLPAKLEGLSPEEKEIYKNLSPEQQKEIKSRFDEIQDDQLAKSREMGTIDVVSALVTLVTGTVTMVGLIWLVFKAIRRRSEK